MIEVLPESETDVLAVVVSGRLRSEDYDKLRLECDLRVERHANFDLLVELSDIEGAEPEVIREDLSFLKEYRDRVRRMAIVTEETLWQRLADLLGKPFGVVLGMEVERFDDRVGAWKWLRSS